MIRLPTQLREDNFVSCIGECQAGYRDTLIGWLNAFFGMHPEFDSIYSELAGIGCAIAHEGDELFEGVEPSKQFEIWKEVVLQEVENGRVVSRDQERGSEAILTESLRDIHG